MDDIAEVLRGAVVLLVGHGYCPSRCRNTSACPGKVEAGFPKGTCATSKAQRGPCSTAGRYLVDLSDFLGRHRPAGGMDVLLDLLRPGGAGNHARDRTIVQQPAECQIGRASCRERGYITVE